ncbi:MAG: DUF5814 domain-containing protein, partial [Candidatus Lokiarchaeota archaeon]
CIEIKDPFFRGTVLFGLDMKEKMRALRFEKIQDDDTPKPVDPRLFKKFLFGEKIQYIAFSDQTKNEDIAPILEMLKNLHFNLEKVIRLTFCKSCLEKNKFKILKKGIQIKNIKRQTICPECALEIILRQASVRGLVSQGKVSPKLKNFFRHMILKFKDVKKVLESFKPDFDPIFNKDMTLYDIEKSPPINKKYLNYSLKNLDISRAFKNLLNEIGIKQLLPIQAISVENGLLSEHINQLIMAPTSGGKTLIGEIAGVSKILKNEDSESSQKMLYLVPIVALANVREEEFKEKYSKLGIKVVKKVGESLLGSQVEKSLDDLKDADIIIGTYEAIDFILRSGNKNSLDGIKTVVVDEIQTLIDPERGFILDGLIGRLKILYPNAQFLYLSATIGEPKILARKLQSILIKYSNRPVPVERHLILCLNEKVKIKYILRLVRTAFSQKSTFGYKGQSIVFTNTRKKCESISSYLQKRGLRVEPYHSGLTNEERKLIEDKFQNQHIAGVVATAALAAGVDFPASQVIFESLAMGIKWLTVADFEQMLGRAGRLKKHDKGYAYLLVQPEKVYSPQMEKTEENIAIRLLNGKIKDFELEPNEDRSLTELLAFVSMYNNPIVQGLLNKFYMNLINGDYNLDALLKKLNNLKVIERKNTGKLKITQLGRALAKSFFTVEEGFDIIKHLRKGEKSIKEIVLELKPLRNVYLSKTVVADLSKNVNMKYFSNNFFSASVLSLMDAEYVKKRKKFSKEFIQLILKWINDIFNCKCKDSPYCECGRLTLEKNILDLRMERGFSVEDILNFLEREYEILVFKGDIIDYLESLIYSFESIKSIAEGIEHLDRRYVEELKSIPTYVEKIKR